MKIKLLFLVFSISCLLCHAQDDKTPNDILTGGYRENAGQTKPTMTKLVSENFSYKFKHGEYWGQWSKWKDGNIAIVINEENQITVLPTFDHIFDILEIGHETPSRMEYLAVDEGGLSWLITFEYSNKEAFICIEGNYFMYVYKVSSTNFSLNPFYNIKRAWEE